MKLFQLLLLFDMLMFYLGSLFLKHFLMGSCLLLLLLLWVLFCGCRLIGRRSGGEVGSRMGSRMGKWKLEEKIVTNRIDNVYMYIYMYMYICIAYNSKYRIQSIMEQIKIFLLQPRQLQLPNFPPNLSKSLYKIFLLMTILQFIN